ncbi:hypothetical protein DMUE_4034 [Dictyocoela muelleri]|nr:hypothetical protein DMUE_4034 [Dictyocoela muelleri]
MVSYKKNLYCFYFNNSNSHHQSRKDFAYNHKGREFTGKDQSSRSNLRSVYNRHLIGLVPLSEQDNSDKNKLYKFCYQAPKMTQIKTLKMSLKLIKNNFLKNYD